MQGGGFVFHFFGLVSPPSVKIVAHPRLVCRTLKQLRPLNVSARPRVSSKSRTILAEPSCLVMPNGCGD